MKPGRFTIFSIYTGVALLMGLGLGEAVIALEILGPRSDLEKTHLEQRIAGAREIKQALGKPLPPMKPLPTITARLANPHSVQVADGTRSTKNPWSKTNSLSPQAMDAMAKSYSEPETRDSTGSSDYAADSNSRDAYDASSRRSLSQSASRYSTKFDRAAGNHGF